MNDTVILHCSMYILFANLESVRGDEEQFWQSFLFDSTQVADRKEFLMSRRVTLFIDVESRL